MSNAIISQVSKNLPFLYRIVCPQIDKIPKGIFELPVQNQLPRFGEFENQAQFADVRVGWHEKGLLFTADVTGKKQSLWCRETQLLESDGVQIWIDTRDTHNVHRATKFCHWMIFMPTGGGGAKDKPITSVMKINRSREVSPSINRGKIICNSQTTENGYRLTTFIPADSLFGWNPVEHRRLGFNYEIVDRELGRQTLAVGPEYPISEDPSLWQSLDLV